MNRNQRAEALARIPADEAVKLAERLADGALGEVVVITPPTVGMVMARAIDGAHGDTFNLGEVLVTEARVSLAGVEGWGMVVGSQREHALAMAVVDACLEAGHPRRPAVERTLSLLVSRANARRTEELQRVAPTRVHFENF
jgi:alpha-D-ribose 1-methylphosphonate 5-triphosphate synthase subunit PhnG